MKKFENIILETSIFKGVSLNQSSVEPKYTLEVCFDLDNNELLSSWYSHKELIYMPDNKNASVLLSQLGLKKCVKSKATHYIIVALKSECGSLINKGSFKVWACSL